MTLWAAIKHGDVLADGMTLRLLGSRTVIGYLQPSGALLAELSTYRGVVTRPLSTLTSDPRLARFALQAGACLWPGLSVGGIDRVSALVAREPTLDPVARNDLLVSLARADRGDARFDELRVMARQFHHGSDDLSWRVLCTRGRIETALADNRAIHARDAAHDLAIWLQGRNAEEHLRTMRDAASLCSLLLARGIDTRQFLEQIQQHPRAELLMIEAI